ncbi:hypothetical protein BP6252_01162 [Coleophoma cylindrospora]|uniref:Methyltransferase domain-containing protein n=1 Tax=Coleophoma cylindrospora TaxID=1849047 RepID=A0A3D8SS33_9HELO|nr:hypothetical protein BP6252_01162 [Coleophoma cylindrospora]
MATPAPQVLAPALTALNDSMVETYHEENRGIPRQFARHITTLGPEITASSVIHDNACGPAVVTIEILNRISDKSQHPTIMATDISPGMVRFGEKTAKSNGWDTVTCDVMNASKLSFKDDTFTHSFTNFIIPVPPGCLEEIHRTLKPDGTAIFTSWKSNGFINLIRRAATKIRPDAEFGEVFEKERIAEDEVRKNFENAGFRDVHVVARAEKLYFKDRAELEALLFGPFGKFITKTWTEEEVARLPDVAESVLTEEEAKVRGVDLTACVVTARK